VHVGTPLTGFADSTVLPPSPAEAADVVTPARSHPRGVVPRQDVGGGAELLNTHRYRLTVANCSVLHCRSLVSS
jgi:hypothetical protein